MSCASDPIAIRPAEITDAEAIEALVEPYVQRRVLLRRSLEELRDLTRNGFIAQRQGIGKLLVQACIDCAREHQVLEVMAITAAEQFFRDCGFDYALPDQKKALFINTRPRY